jgi:hypothetical protein
VIYGPCGREPNVLFRGPPAPSRPLATERVGRFTVTQSCPAWILLVCSARLPAFPPVSAALPRLRVTRVSGLITSASYSGRWRCRSPVRHQDALCRLVFDHLSVIATWVIAGMRIWLSRLRGDHGCTALLVDGLLSPSAIPRLALRASRWAELPPRNGATVGNSFHRFAAVV